MWKFRLVANMKIKLFFVTLALIGCASLLQAQKGVIRGNVIDSETGEPIIFGNVRILGSSQGTNTDENGFFSLGDLAAGNYKIVAMTAWWSA